MKFHLLYYEFFMFLLLFDTEIRKVCGGKKGKNGKYLPKISFFFLIDFLLYRLISRTSSAASVFYAFLCVSLSLVCNKRTLNISQTFGHKHIGY